MSRTIFIVEDDGATLALWRKHLEFQGFNVECANCVEEAQNLLDIKYPSLIILDINLATPTTGWEWLVQLRAESQTRELPILVVSTLDEPHRATDLGATAFLRKPCSPIALIEQISQVLGSAA
jgi:DNA-binding response OmpR family regulator